MFKIAQYLFRFLRLVSILFLSIYITKAQVVEPDFSIPKFLPVRSVIKPNTEIPLFALIKNSGSNPVSLHSKLILQDVTILESGSIDQDLGLLNSQVTDSISWIVKFNTIGTYELALQVFSENDTIQQDLTLSVTDAYWQAEKFLLSAYNPPYAWRGEPYEDSDFTYYKNAHFDNFLWVRDEEALVQKVHQFGFKYFLDIAQSIGDENEDIEYLLRGTNDEAPPDITEDLLQQLDDLIDIYKDDPDLLGYYICDEPYGNAFDNIAKVVSRIKIKDPERYSFVNLWPYFENEEGDDTPEEGDDTFLEDFIQKTKIELLSYDRYNFYNSSDDNDAYFDQIARIRKQALKYAIPFCNIIQAIGTNGTSVSWDSTGDGEHLDWRTPNQAEHRWLVYSSLVYGVHGIVWFHWDCCDWGVVENPDRDVVYQSIKNINTEIDSLSQIMLHLKTKQVYHLDNNTITNTTESPDLLIETSNNCGLVVGTFSHEEAGDKYFMLMNKNYSESVSTHITINTSMDNLQVFNVDTNSWDTVTFNSESSSVNFELELRKGGGKLYKYATEEAIPKIILLQNYPNPFSDTTIITYSVPGIQGDSSGETQHWVSLKIYDILGRKVATLVNNKQGKGNYEVVFDAGNLANGIYLYSLKVDTFVSTKRMLHLR